MDKLMMFLGYYITLVTIFVAIIYLLYLLGMAIKRSFMWVKLYLMTEDQLTQLICSASALLEQKARR